MTETTPEQRRAVMILVDVTWEDQSGTSQKTRACMVNRSTGGACIRLRQPIPVGAKLRVQWRWEQFTGTTRYCRTEGRDYYVGIQRDAEQKAVTQMATQESIAQRNVMERLAAEENTNGQKVLAQDALAKAVEKRTAQPSPGALWSGLARRQGNAAAAQTMSPTDFLLEALEAIEPEPLPGAKEFAVLRGTERHERPIEQAKEASKERKHMARKWFDVGQKDETQGNGNWNAPGIPANSAEPVQSPVASNVSEKKMNVREAEDAASSIELLSMTDIYQSAGILNPRKGYSILKVVEMLRSEHLRGLAKEMKRATVLVALDAAGITVDEVTQDAKARLEAIDAYEAEQRKQFETLLARKAEENQQIMAELERIKATYAERMRRNLEGVAREKATFGNWLATKQQESQSITEALELCLKTESSEPASHAGNNGLVSTPIKTV
jgi:hypothetical protein